MIFKDVEIEAFGLKKSRGENREKWWSYKLRLSGSGMGEMSADEALEIKFDYRSLAKKLYQLDNRTLQGDALIAFGQELAAYLLPDTKFNERSSIRSLFETYRTAAALEDPAEGVRLRLKLGRELSTIPWEFVYLPPPGGSGGVDGFLALDGRISIVRHESLDTLSQRPTSRGAIQLLAAFAAPTNAAPLDLKREKDNLVNAAKGNRGIKRTILMDSKFGQIEENILEKNVGIFHFGGHGEIHEQMGSRPSEVETTAYLLFDDGPIPAEQLAINLRDSGVRLAMLGACNSGRRAGKNRWAGVASAFVKAGVPAVIANQFKIKDNTAIAFSKLFYKALVANLSIEEAVAAGRKGAYNADPGGRDWGIQTLYMRSEESQVLFGGSASKKVRQKIATEVKEVINNTNSGTGTMVIGNVTGNTIVFGDSTSNQPEQPNPQKEEETEANEASAGFTHPQAQMIKDELKKLQDALIALTDGETIQRVKTQIALIETELTTKSKPNDGEIMGAVNEISEQVPDGNAILKSAFISTILAFLIGEDTKSIIELL